jgi:hypothetical protein
MRTLLVLYDLNRPGQEYAKLIARLKNYPKWWHYLDSAWLLKADATAAEARDELRPLIDRNDELLVLDVTKDAAAWAGFSARAGGWIKDNL